MERPGLDDLIVLGFRFFSTLLGVRVAALAAAALRAVGHCCCVVSLAPRCLGLFLRSGASSRVARCWELARGWREVSTTAFFVTFSVLASNYELWRPRLACSG